MGLVRKLLPILFVCISCVLFSMCNNESAPVNPPDGDGGGGNGNNIVNHPPQAVINVSPTERAYTQHQNVTFSGIDSSDPDNNITTYEWDFSYDDVTFNPESVGPTLTHSLMSFGSVVAALRVSDGGNPPLSSIARKRLNVKPSGEIVNITNGKVTKFMLRRAVASYGGVYALYTGTYNGVKGAYVQRSADNGKTWGEPVIVSSLPDDSGPLGIWMDSAPKGIVLAWMNNNGTKLKYSYGSPDGESSMKFSSPTTLETLPQVVMYEAVLYSVACTPSGDYAFILYMTASAYELKLVVAKLDPAGAVLNHSTHTVKVDNDERRKISGASVASGPTGRGFITYIWKSLGYDNEDEVHLVYFTPPNISLEGPVRVDYGLTGFVFDHDPYVIVNNNDEPIVYMRTTGIYQGARDIALCISDGNPPTFRPAIRGNNTLGGDPLAWQNSPSATFDRKHGHLWLAFEDFRDNPKVSQVYLAMFDDHYSTLLPDFDISDDPSFIYSDVNPQICFVSGDAQSKTALVVVWERNGTDIVAYHAEY